MTTLTDLLKIGTDVYDVYNRSSGAENATEEMNRGFIDATNQVVNFGNRSLDALQAGATQANQAITGATQQASTYQQPFYDTGLAALSEFRDILANPSQILNVPGVQFQYEQGLEAVNRALEGNRLLNSSARLNAVTEFGQGLASTALDSALNRRLPLIQSGQNAANNLSTIQTNAGRSLADIATTTGANIANVNRGMGDSISNLTLAQAQNLAGDPINDAMRNTGLLDILTSDESLGVIGGALGSLGKALGIDTSQFTLENIGSSIGEFFGLGGAAAGGATVGAGVGVGAADPLISAAQAPLTPLAPGVEAAPVGSTAGAAVGNFIDPTQAATGGAAVLGAIGGGLLGNRIGNIFDQGASAATGATIGGALGGVFGPIGAGAGAIGGAIIGNVLGSITGFGDKESPDFDIITSGSGNFENGLYVETPFGRVGFNEATSRDMNQDQAQGLIDEIIKPVAELDMKLAQNLNAQEIAAVKQALEGQQIGNAHKAEVRPSIILASQHLDAVRNTLSASRQAQIGLDSMIAEFNRNLDLQMEAAMDQARERILSSREDTTFAQRIAQRQIESSLEQIKQTYAKYRV